MVFSCKFAAYFQISLFSAYYQLIFNFPIFSEHLCRAASQPAITCLKLAKETLEQGCEICSKLTIKTPKRHHWRRFGVFIVNFEHISHLCSSVSIVNFEQVNDGWVLIVVFENS